MKEILMSCKAVVLDVDQTLIDVADIGKSYSDSLAKFGVNISPEILDESLHRAWFAIRDRYINKDNNYQTDSKREKDTWREFSKILCSYHEEPKDFEGFFEDIYQEFAKASSRKITPGVVDFIKSVKQAEKKLGLLTNNDERTVSVLKEMELDSCFDFMGIACVLGFKKPSPKAFELTAKGLGLETNQCVFIGNSVELDYHGPKKAGMIPILYDLQEEPVPDSVENNFTHFDQLTRIIQSSA